MSVDSTVFEPLNLHDIQPYQQILPRIVSEYGHTYGSLIKEMLLLSMRNQRLTTDEYMKLRLYDNERFSWEEKKNFVGLAKILETYTTLTRHNRWTSLMDNKVAFENLISGYGLATPKTLAVYGGDSAHPNPPVLKSADALHDFLSRAKLPVFAKPIDSTNSFGSTLIRGYDPESRTLTLHQNRKPTLDEFCREADRLFPDGFLFQKLLNPCPQMKKLCGESVPTVRVVVLDSGNGPEIFRAAIKLTGGGNVADNFWRIGNLLCAVDPETGKLGKAVSKYGFDAEYVERHPDTDEQIEGVQISDWQTVRKLVLTTAKILTGVMITGYDVALTDKGPVIVEANTHPDVIMMQIADGKGIWGPEIEAAIAVEKKKDADIQAKNKKVIRATNKSRKENIREGLRKSAA